MLSRNSSHVLVSHARHTYADTRVYQLRFEWDVLWLEGKVEPVINYLFELTVISLHQSLFAKLILFLLIFTGNAEFVSSFPSNC